MICNRSDEGWELIYQQAHALLAAALVAHWHEAHRSPRWPETLVAIAQHDNGWQEWESGRRLTDGGEPLDFMETPPEDIVAQAARAVTRAWHQSLWVGLLVSQHISHLHEPRRGAYEPLDELLDAQQQMQAQWRELLGIDEADALNAYDYLRWGDTLSLVLCRRQLSCPGATVPIGKGPRGVAYHARCVNDGVLTVVPWPFCEEAFTVTLDAYQVAQYTFPDADTLANSIYQRPPTVVQWRVTPPPL